MQLFGKPNRYTLFYYFILKTLPATVKPVLLFRLPPLLPKVKKGSSLAERKQKVRFDSVSLHSHFTFRFLTAQPLRPSLFSIFPLLLVLTILPQNTILQSNRGNKSNKIKGIKNFWKQTPTQIAPNFPGKKTPLLYENKRMYICIHGNNFVSLYYQRGRNTLLVLTL